MLPLSDAVLKSRQGERRRKRKPPSEHSKTPHGTNTVALLDNNK
jgi:hypothetical protein